MGSNLTIKRLGKDSLKEQVEVYMRSFDVKNTFDSVQNMWIKEHYENPVHEAYIFGAFDATKLVSINAYMPMKYRYQDKECNVIQSCVSGTIPEYRGKGIWSKLVKHAIEYFREEGKYDFLIGFPNYKTSYGGFIKMNWSHDSDAINYLMIVNGRQFAKAALNRNIPPTAILSLQQIKIKLARASDFRTGEMSCIAEINDTQHFSLVVNETFIKWKKAYKGLEGFGVYTSDGKFIANCRYYIGNYHDCKIVKLCDIKLFDKTKAIRSVYAYCISEIVKKQIDAAFIRVWAMDGSLENKIYKSLLFVKDGKHQNPFITYSLKNDIISEKTLHNKKNWINATFLDLD